MRVEAEEMGQRRDGRSAEELIDIDEIFTVKMAALIECVGA